MGRHGLPREFVAENHRERLIAGLAIAVAEHGYDAATVADITKAAGVSRRTFYRNFNDKQACFLAAFEIVVEQVGKGVADAVNPDDSWVDRVRAGMAALLCFFSHEPELARLCIVEPMNAGGDVAARYGDVLRSFVSAFQVDRPQLPGGPPVPESVEDAVIGGIASLLASRVSVGEADQLEALLPDLMRAAITPYLGAEEAQRLAGLRSA